MAHPTGASTPNSKSLSVEIRGGRLDFDGAPLFAALDFDLAPGRWTCILGPSGVGKSSLLRLIAGLADPPPQTLITANDGVPLRGRIALMAQQDLLLPWLSVVDNVLLGPRLRRESVASRRPDADALLRRLGMGHRAEARPAELSGGERQRAALARTLLENRPLVLMDEPFSGLDAITRHELQAEAAAVLAGRTVLHITHDPWEALRLAHRLYVMAGRPARLGRPIDPPGDPPRDVGDPALAARHAALLGELAAARMVA